MAEVVYTVIMNLNLNKKNIQFTPFYTDWNILIQRYT